MSDLFNIYEDNLNVTIDKIKKISETFSNLSKEKAEYAIQSANNLFKEGEKLLKQMDIECSANTNKTGNKLIMKLKNYNNEFELEKKQFLKLQENYIAQKAKDALILMSEGNERQHADTGHNYHKLIEHEEKSIAQRGKLEQAKIMAFEVEKDSHDVMRSLDQQTNHMKDIKIKVNGINNKIDESNSLLNFINKRQGRNKVLIGGFVIILVVILLVILISKLV